ncbi:E3 ubiquitin-protein ligase ari-2 [Arctopsyche grandis]|uniref:E3 ubiquitin-protein ligase ari-2 n=1 Tax=Arctopsyche grandis TaxID=121162 RepID=UPI00406D6873
MSESEMELSEGSMDGGSADERDYYEGVHEDCEAEAAERAPDPDFFLYNCLTPDLVDKMLNESIERLTDTCQVTPSLAKVMLHAYKWNEQELIQKYKENARVVLISCKVKPAIESNAGGSSDQGSSSSDTNSSDMCSVCASITLSSYRRALACGHSFCNDCWAMHFEVQIMQGVSTGIECMATNCEVRAPEDFVLALVHKPSLRDRYQQFCFQDYVKSHPQLRYCPGPNCQVVIQGKSTRGGQVVCGTCGSRWCFRCGAQPHAPVDCSLIKRWLTKCADDSETANYISAHTKDCPACQICIEKNGGCNHMQCYACRHDFCWMCLGEWRTHGSEYYECSRYRENPGVAHDSHHAQAREALKKYLHYYERWENHAKSLRLEEHTLESLRNKINEKVSSGNGTWIDWQPLFDGAALLARCRYTLQYTYPYAYFMEQGPRKELFEYQQAQLEAEIENLSWKIERAETTDKGDLQNQMNIAEKRRTTLLKEFLEL